MEQVERTKATMSDKSPSKSAAEYTFNEVKEAINSSISIAEVMQKLDIVVNNGNYRKMRRIAEHHKLTLPLFDNSSTGEHRSHPRLSDAEYFIKGKTRNTETTKKRLVKSYGFKLECSMEGCEVKETWLGRKIVLHLDHINSDSFDNRVENLRLLCPNCHSQTETYGSGGEKRYCVCACKRRKPIVEGEAPDFCPHAGKTYEPKKCPDCGTEKIDKDAKRCRSCAAKKRASNQRLVEDSIYPEMPTLIALIEEKGFLAYSKELGVSDNAIRKHMQRRGVNPLPHKLTKGERLKRQQEAKNNPA